MDMSFTVEVTSTLFSKMSSAMDEVITDTFVDSVGGFKVGVVYDNGFKYVQYGKMYRSDMEMHGAGAHVMGHGPAEEGAYSINFIGGSADHNIVAVHVRQGKFGVLYERKSNGLLRPAVFQLDEVDFIDLLKEKYNIDAAFGTQDRLQKYIVDGLANFQEGNFAEAKKTFEKGLPIATGKIKADLCLFLGTTHLNLRNPAAAIRIFQQAINTDGSYQTKVMQILNQSNSERQQ
jgi:hypothetical protein